MVFPALCVGNGRGTLLKGEANPVPRVIAFNEAAGRVSAPQGGHRLVRQLGVVSLPSANLTCLSFVL